MPSVAGGGEYGRGCGVLVLSEEQGASESEAVGDGELEGGSRRERYEGSEGVVDFVRAREDDGSPNGGGYDERLLEIDRIVRRFIPSCEPSSLSV